MSEKDEEKEEESGGERKDGGVGEEEGRTCLNSFSAGP